jgi:haloacetate dehalogenase
VLDIIPTVGNWRALTGPAGVFAFHLYMLALPVNLPKRMIGADGVVQHRYVHSRRRARLCW